MRIASMGMALVAAICIAPAASMAQDEAAGQVEVEPHFSSDLVASYEERWEQRWSNPRLDRAGYENLAEQCLTREEQGSALACRMAGHAYLTGDEVEIDRPRAGRLLVHACSERGDRLACYALAEEAVREDESRLRLAALQTAYDQVSEICEDGLLYACLEQALIYRDAPAPLGDAARWARLINSTCERGEDRACRLFRDFGAQAYEEYRALCETSPRLCRTFAQAFVTGQLVPRNLDYAWGLNTIGCQADEMESCFYLAGRLASSDRFSNHRRAIELYGRACASAPPSRDSARRTAGGLSYEKAEEACALGDELLTRSLGYVFSEEGLEYARRTCKPQGLGGQARCHERARVLEDTREPGAMDLAFELYEANCRIGEFGAYGPSCVRAGDMVRHASGQRGDPERAAQFYEQPCRGPRPYQPACDALQRWFPGRNR